VLAVVVAIMVGSVTSSVLVAFVLGGLAAIVVLLVANLLRRGG
jgi:hypothetical protein